MSRRKFEGLIRSSINARSLTLMCKVLHECFVCMVVRQWFGWRSKDLGLGLYNGQPKDFIGYNKNRQNTK